MRETAQILELWREAKQRGEEAVLATVIQTRGSSYRLPGARLLLTKSGKRAGSVSGGCLEEDLIKKAWWLTEAGSAIRRYDTTSDGEIGSPYGLGCNGIIHLHLQRLQPSVPGPLAVIERVWQTRTPEQIEHPSTGGADAFVETVRPPVRLLVFGAGDDAVPLVELAQFLGWQVSVFDGRAHYARAERFSCSVDVRVRAAGSGGFSVDHWTVAVLMSHSYSQDLGVLGELAQNPPPYIGILGPKKRTVQLMADANVREAELLPALHAPIGLDIGADGPHQVALSVASEIQGFLNGRDGGHLHARFGSIHARGADESEASFHVQSIVCA